MKTKTIKKVLNSKFRHLLESISDKNVRKVMQENTIISGGAIVSMLLNEKPNDFDMYFTTLEAAKTVAEYFVKEYKKHNPPKEIKHLGEVVTDIYVKEDDGRIRIIVQSAGIASETSSKNEYHYFEQDDPGDLSSERYIENVMVALTRRVGKPDGDKEDQKYRPIFLTSNAITLEGQVQLIIRFYGDADEIHENYDFVHCTSWWQSWNNTLHLRPEALECILTKELRYQGSLYPLCTLFRLRKYIKRGWTCTAGEILKMAFQINELELSDPEILEDQIIGVDVAYFTELLQALRKENPKDINSTYIIQLIDSLE